MQKHYKAWICDFDGTVVGKGWSLSPIVKKAIENLIDKNIIFSLATGRPYQGIIQTACKQQLPLALTY